MTAASSTNLNSLIIESAKVGFTDCDLTNVGYGTPHWVDKRAYITNPFSYYFFLAGFVHVTHSHRIVEIGTHCGGSVKAMVHGIQKHLCPDVVTIDITDLAHDLRGIPGVVKLTGDATSRYVIEATCDHYGSQPVHLLFIDGDHRYAPTLASFFIYTSLLKPRYVVLDDISLNREMDEAWERICGAYPGRAVNAAKLVPRVRPAEMGREGPHQPERLIEPGFGVVSTS